MDPHLNKIYIFEILAKSCLIYVCISQLTVRYFFTDETQLKKRQDGSRLYSKLYRLPRQLRLVTYCAAQSDEKVLKGGTPNRHTLFYVP